MCTLSDLIGRRTILFVNQLGSFGACCIATHVMFFQLHPMWFLIGSFFYCLSGGFAVLLGIAFATISFHSAPADRFKNIVLGDVVIGCSGLLLAGVGVWMATVTIDQYYIGGAVGTSLSLITLLLTFCKFREDPITTSEETSTCGHIATCIKDMR